MKGNVIGGKDFVIMAGPCAVETADQLYIIAKEVKKAGVSILRGGAFKPRTSPYAFQGLEEEGLKMLRNVADELKLLIVSEIMDYHSLDLFMKYDIDILQVGARNMQNFALLKELGKIKKPILLKRGMSATIKETLLAAEYVLAGGNAEVILCERGIRTFEDATRNTLDLSAVALFKEMSHLPVIVDPSHAAGRPSIIPALSKAAMAVGADGLLIEVHHDPANAMCDGAQALLPSNLRNMTKELKKLAPVLGRTM